MRSVVTIAAVLLIAPAGAQARQGLPLGPDSLRETRTVDVLAPGVRYTKIVRGALSKADGWTADVAVVRTRAEAQDLARRVRGAGFEAEVETLERPPDDRGRGPLGYRVHSGLFDAKAGADERVAALRAAGLPARGSVFTAEDGERTSGPWVVHVLGVEAGATQAPNQLPRLGAGPDDRDVGRPAFLLRQRSADDLRVPDPGREHVRRPRLPQRLRPERQSVAPMRPRGDEEEHRRRHGDGH